jgi:NTE family protein
MLYHVGVLRRLNEFGLLGSVDRFSSVSGGSITSAVLALHWNRLTFGPDGVASGLEEVEKQLFDLAGRTIDVASAFVGLLPGTTGADRHAKKYQSIFGDADLQDLPNEPPRFVFNTTNMLTGNLFRWSKTYAADYGLGVIDQPTLSIAEIVAASSAFPPFLSPLHIAPPPPVLDHNSRVRIDAQPSALWLTDGGVYDNLGIQTAESFQTVMASDGGTSLPYRNRVGHNLWAQHRRSVVIIYDQVCRLRQRQFVSELNRGERLGCLWRIGTDMEKYPAPDTLDCPPERTRTLAGVPTRLAKLPNVQRHRLMNWGYASADAAVRSYVEPSLAPPSGFPYPDGVG